MSHPVLGIDLGTTNSVVAVTNKEGVPRVLADKVGNRIHPSVVAFLPNGKVTVGSAAKLRKPIDPQNTIYSVKRLMGRTSQSSEVVAMRKRVPYRISEGRNEQPLIKTRGGEFAPADISALIIDHLRRIAAEQLASDADALDRAVITVPANFGEAQRSATATAGAIAGLSVVRVLNEPTAAAIAYGHRKQLQRVVAVYDFGGGTFDVSILKIDGDHFEVVGTAGDAMLGGDDMDERLVQGMVREFLEQHRLDLTTNPEAMMRLRQLAEDVKIELSRTVRSKVRIEEIAYGAGGKPLSLEVEMARPQFEKKIAGLVDRTFPVCDEALLLAGIGKSGVTDVVLVGGTTRIPCVQQRVAEYFGRAPRTDINPDEAIAAGAALQGNAIRAALAQSAAVQVPGGTGDTVTDVDPSLPSSPKLPPPIPGPRTDTEVPTQQRPLAKVNLAKRRATSAAVTERARAGAIQQPRVSAPSATTIAESSEDAGTTIRRMLDDSVDQPIPGVPVVRDVTPHSLGIATVGGYCDVLVRRNTQLPAKRERTFTAAHDGQRRVQIRIYQGESRVLRDNSVIGTLVLDGLAGRERGQTSIDVSFDIDGSGMLHVSARDSHSGQERQARLDILGAKADDEIEAAKKMLAGLM